MTSAKCSDFWTPPPCNCPIHATYQYNRHVFGNKLNYDGGGVFPENLLVHPQPAGPEAVGPETVLLHVRHSSACFARGQMVSVNPISHRSLQYSVCRPVQKHMSKAIAVSRLADSVVKCSRCYSLCFEDGAV